MKQRKLELLPGTLDMLTLKALSIGKLHGYAIARRLKQSTEGVLSVEEGTLYPALHRMERRTWIKAAWGLSESNRRAKYYTITRQGRKQLALQEDSWTRMTEAVARVMGAGAGTGSKGA